MKRLKIDKHEGKGDNKVLIAGPYYINLPSCLEDYRSMYGNDADNVLWALTSQAWLVKLRSGLCGDESKDIAYMENKINDPFSRIASATEISDNQVLERATKLDRNAKLILLRKLQQEMEDLENSEDEE